MSIQDKPPGDIERQVHAEELTILSNLYGYSVRDIFQINSKQKDFKRHTNTIKPGHTRRKGEKETCKDKYAFSDNKQRGLRKREVEREQERETKNQMFFLFLRKQLTDIENIEPKRKRRRQLGIPCLR